jgi:hypothetical protein
VSVGLLESQVLEFEGVLAGYGLSHQTQHPATAVSEQLCNSELHRAGGHVPQRDAASFALLVQRFEVYFLGEEGHHPTVRPEGLDLEKGLEPSRGLRDYRIEKVDEPDEQ